MNRGVYAIINNLNGRCYIGSSTNIKRRYGEHKSILRNNKHKSRLLQTDWNEKGEECFSFEILELLDDSEDRTKEYLLDLEQTCLSAFECVYNSNAFVSGKYKKCSIETRQQMSLKKKGKSVNKNCRDAALIANTGRKHSEEHSKAVALGNSKTYIVYPLQGDAILVKNLKDFCRRNDLNSSTMSKTAIGERKQHKGWRCEYLNPTDKESRLLKLGKTVATLGARDTDGDTIVERGW